MVNCEHYTYRVTWSEEDNEFIGLCAEFPSLSFLAKARTAALDGIVDTVMMVVEDLSNNEETIPAPISEKHFSGKFQVRIPPEQHRMLAIKAAEFGISLNRYISSILI